MSTLVTTALRHNTSASNNMVLDSNGRVGIGTAAPASPLDVVGAARVSGDLSFNSGYGSVAVSYGCRAWVNFDGRTGGTVAIRASGNVSSITDNGVGLYRVNFTSSMPDVNYAVLVDMIPSVSNAGSDTFPINYGTGNVEVRHYEANVLRDSDAVNVAIFR